MERLRQINATLKDTAYRQGTRSSYDIIASIRQFAPVVRKIASSRNTIDRAAPKDGAVYTKQAANSIPADI
tara:strand:+ start:1393 stop:1605 length:213 start_codon:yes stop_codon:yes gene_type:complete